MCQLVKEFFLDQADKLLIGGDELFENMMQSVRCCNDQYLQSLIKSLPKSKQAQLAFLVIHLQSAVEAGRLTGELACCFGAVVVGEGAPRNKNDPKELLQKMIELPGIFWRGLVSAESVNAANCSMLGPVDKSESTEWLVHSCYRYELLTFYATEVSMNLFPYLKLQNHNYFC